METSGIQKLHITTYEASGGNKTNITTAHPTGSGRAESTSIFELSEVHRGQSAGQTTTNWKTDVEEKIKAEYAKKREEQYGKNAEDLPDSTIDQIMDDYAEAFANNKVKESEPETGVKVTEFGDWISTEIELYNGKKYSELSPEEQAKVDEYKAELKKRENLSEEQLAVLEPLATPEGIEFSSEIRIQNKNGELKTDEPDSSEEAKDTTPYENDEPEFSDELMDLINNFELNPESINFTFISESDKEKYEEIKDKIEQYIIEYSN